jgi:asparagine synthase (glutamine-hydrolysing)
MCGIAGIIKLNPQEKVNEVLVKRMGDVLQHRGPDDEGFWIQGQVGLAHRRLSIVDVDGGRQPMMNEDHTIWIVFNGEIYNHRELRQELEAKGHRYRTRSDTETILHLYEEEGERCVERLQGMFAFAIWDRNREQLLLARDRLGIKPLYYSFNNDELLFASEIKGILAAGSVKLEFNTSILPEFLATRFISGKETFFRGVYKLLPGHTLTWSLSRGMRSHLYWRPQASFDAPRRSLKEEADELRLQLESTIQSHLMSDVPLGLFLSGGLDSSGIAALMAPMIKEPIRTFGVGFAEAEANELSYSRLMARSVGAEHREVVVTPEEYFNALPKLIWHEDEPIAFPSSVPLYFVSRLARQHVKVVLTGEGADELFLGYPRYWVTAWNEKLGLAYERLVPGAVREKVKHILQKLPMRRYTERSFLALEPDIRSLFYENFSVFSGSLQERLLADQESLVARDPYAEGLRCYREATGGMLERMTQADLQTYLVELLMKQDQMSMAASIESRVPFLDHKLVEHVLSIPGRFKLQGWKTKVVLREVLRNRVPKEILTRGKMGFPVPVNRWFRDRFRPIVEEFVLGPRALQRELFEPSVLRHLAEEHMSGVREHGDRLWLLINLEIWQRIFLEGEETAGIMEKCLGRNLKQA